MTRRQKEVELSLMVHVETDKAWFLSDTGELKDAVWVPKSQADDGGDAVRGSKCDFLLPEWLAIDKGLGSGRSISPAEMAKVLKEKGATKVRECYHMGMNDQPRTVRFTALSDSYARMMGSAVSKANNPSGDVRQGGGILYAHGFHWETKR